MLDLKIQAVLKKRKALLIAGFLFLVIFLGIFIRIQNLGLLEGKYLAGGGSYLLLRYVKELHNTGMINSIDLFRAYPFGTGLDLKYYTTAHIVNFLHSAFSFLGVSNSIEQSLIFSPLVFFALLLIVFFFLVRKLIDLRTAVASTVLLSILPGEFLLRTAAGVGKKEPLGFTFILASLLFYALAFQSKNKTKTALIGLTAGILTLIAGFTWGGGIILTGAIPVFALICFFLNNFQRNDLTAYTAWSLPVLAANLTNPLSLNFLSPLIALLVLLAGFLVEKFKSKIKFKTSFLVFMGLAALGVITFLFLNSFFVKALDELLFRFAHPIGRTRELIWMVVELQPTTLSYWQKTLTVFLPVMLVAFAYYLFHNLKHLKRWAYALTALFTFYVLMVVYGQSYSFGFNWFPVFSLAFFVLFFAWLQFLPFKNKKLSEKISKLDKNFLFVLTLFLLTLLMAKGTLRNLFFITPFAAIILGFFTVKFPEKINLSKKKTTLLRGAVIAIIVLLSLMTFQYSLGVASLRGPAVNSQWKKALSFIDEATPEDAVFASWWPYGYWIQGLGERKTNLDPAAGAYSFFAREVLIEKDLNKAFRFFDIFKTTHLILDSKTLYYTRELDFMAQPQKPFTIGLFFESTPVFDGNKWYKSFTGGKQIEEELVFSEASFPAGRSYTRQIYIPWAINENSNPPLAEVTYSNQKKLVPIKCLFTNGKKIEFDVNGLNDCLYLVPWHTKGKRKEMIVYFSQENAATNWVKLYYFNQTEGKLKLIYDDSKLHPPLYYGGKLYGPLKIWEIVRE